MRMRRRQPLRLIERPRPHVRQQILQRVLQRSQRDPSMATDP
jgi:hypothetical protein